MLVARRDPFHAGAHDASLSQRPDFAERGVPRLARAVTMLQVVGSLLAIPVGLASAYSIYRANFSVETTCESLRANIVSMIDKSVDAGTRRMLVRRDVETFEQTCGAVDPDARRRSRHCWRPTGPRRRLPRPIARSPDAPAEGGGPQGRAAPAARQPKQPAAKANPVATAAPERGVTPAVSDAQLARCGPPGLADACAPSRRRLMPRRRRVCACGSAGSAVCTARGCLAGASAGSRRAGAAVTIAPALPPATTVAAPAVPPADADHPVPPASIPESVPPPNADAAKPDEQGHSRIGKWIAQIPLLSTVIENRLALNAPELSGLPMRHGVEIGLDLPAAALARRAHRLARAAREIRAAARRGNPCSPTAARSACRR